jgi:hypothetical protein
VLAQRGIAACEFFLLGQVVERGRQAVGTVFLGNAAQAPQRRLESGRQRDEALAPLEHHRMAPTRVGERELVDPVREGDAGDDHFEFVADGEVGQPEAARRMLLREEDLALGAVHGAPLADAALQGAQDRRAVLARIAPLQFLQQRDRVERGVGLQQRNDLAVPDRCQRISPGTPGPFFALGRQSVAVFDAPGTALADAGLGCGRDLTELEVVLLVLLHLVVRDLLAGQREPSLIDDRLTIDPASRTGPAPVKTGQDSCRRPANLIVANHAAPASRRRSSRSRTRWGPPAVAGHGLARKELVQEMAMRLLALPGKDGADALGLAITHVHAGRSFMALTQSATLQRRSHAQYRRGRTY